MLQVEGEVLRKLLWCIITRIKSPYSEHNMLFVSYWDDLASAAAGLFTTRITESPLRNILLTYRSLLIAAPLVFPFPPLDFSVHISFTSSSSLQCVQHGEKGTVR